jgi:PAS domain S-box-containing protein
MVKIIIAGLNACLGSAVIGLSDAFGMACRAIARSTGVEPFVVTLASADGRAIVDGRGRSIEVETSFEDVAICDAIIVPPLDPDDPPAPCLLASSTALASWMRRHYSRGALVCASGAGVFLLGGAGLLDGRRCAVGWRVRDELKRLFPRAEPTTGSSLVDDRRIVTASAPLAWIDVALHVIQLLCGPEAARLAADATVHEGAAPAGGPHAANAHLAGANFLVEAERVVREAGDAPLSAQDLARALSTSERTLHRRLKQACGESPKSFIDRVRVDIARTLLETSSKSVKELAGGAGFIDEASFRRTFRRFVGMAPGAYRILQRARNHHKAHMFAVQKDSELIPEILTHILDSCVNGVTLTDPDLEDSPIVYANREFERITGYARDEVVGKNCRLLQGDDRDQEGRSKIREAIKKQEHAEVILRNYRKDGTLFHNKLSVTPLFDNQGKLIYYLGVQYDVSDQVRAEQEIGELKAKLSAISRNDPVAQGAVAPEAVTAAGSALK